MANVNVSNKPWGSFRESDYSVEQWHRACLIHLHASAPTAKSECKVPVREPDGTLNRNALGPAAAALAGARQELKAPVDKKRTAARELIRLYRQVGATAPNSTYDIAGEKRPVG